MVALPLNLPEQSPRQRPPGNASGLETVLQQDPRRVIRALRGAADDEDLAILGKLAQPRAELRQRNVRCAPDAFHDQLLRLAYVKKERPFRAVPVGERHVAVKDVGGDHAREIDCVLGASELWRVAQLGFLEVVDRRAHLDRDGDAR